MTKVLSVIATPRYHLGSMSFIISKVLGLVHYLHRGRDHSSVYKQREPSLILAFPGKAGRLR